MKKARGNKLFLLKEAGGTKIEELKVLAKEHSVPVKWVPKQKLDQMSEGGVHQGVVLAITPYQYLTLNELIEQSKSQPFFLFF